MLSNLTIKSKLILLGGTAVTMIVLASATGVYGSMQSSAGLTEVTAITNAVRNVMQADMMHDALRADVLMAMKVGPGGSAAEQREVLASIADHVSSFTDSLAKLAEIDVSPEIKKALVEVGPKLDTYIASAQSFGDIALKDPAAADADFPEFAAAFKDLEVNMQDLGDLIEGSSTTIGAGAQATNDSLLIALIVVAIVSTLLVLTMSVVNATAIGRSIGAMTDAMRVLAGGNTSIEIPGSEQKNEIGTMASAVQVFKDNLIEAERLRAAQEVEQQRQVERGTKMESAVADFDKMITEVVGSISSAATELQSTAQSLSATSEETSRQANAVAAASEQMAQNVQTVATATEELTTSIREIGNQVTESSRIVGGAVTQANDTNAKVKNLSEAAQKIGDVVTLINEIASQTNLLALNATIEAARAGEAGKGIAVVASEVKNLATQTAKATEEIAGQVRAIQESTDSSAQAIQGITQTINRVNEISTAIASAVEEQGAATQEISRNVQQASSGTSEVTSNIGGVTQAAQQTSAGSTQVLSAASELAKNGVRLKSEVEGFLRTVRAL